MEEHFFNWMKLKEETEKGGRGSGNFGHEGRPGKIGGSSSEAPMGRVAFSKVKRGGFSVGYSGRPKDGFMVSIYPERGVSLPEGSLTLDFINKYIERNKDLLDKKKHYAGGWISDGRVFIDISIQVDSHDEAKRLCLDNDQIAYYDVIKKEEIIVNPEAKGAETIMKNFEPKKEEESKEKVYFNSETSQEDLQKIVDYLNGKEEDESQS